MYSQYNMVMRETGKHAMGLPTKDPSKWKDKYTTTLHLIASCLTKLSKVQVKVPVYRGIKRRLPDK